MAMRQKSFAIKLGDVLGGFLDYEDDEYHLFDKAMRIKVNLEITKPLRRGIRIDMGNAVRRWFALKYERLPLFCYWCGKLGHVDLVCKDKSAEIDNKGDFPFGPWLRAPNPNQRTSGEYRSNQNLWRSKQEQRNPETTSQTRNTTTDDFHKNVIELLEIQDKCLAFPKFLTQADPMILKSTDPCERLNLGKIRAMPEGSKVTLNDTVSNFRVTHQNCVNSEHNGEGTSKTRDVTKEEKLMPRMYDNTPDIQNKAHGLNSELGGTMGNRKQKRKLLSLSEDDMNNQKDEKRMRTPIHEEVLCTFQVAEPAESQAREQP